MKKTKKKNDHKDKFTYKPGDLKIIKAKKIKESYSSFAEFLSEKEEKFVASTMRWITIKDEQDRNQHILIKKKDGTILGGMGGTHNGEKLKDVFKDIEAERKEIEKKEAKPYAKSKYDEIDPPSRERFAREMRVAKKIEEMGADALIISPVLLRSRHSLEEHIEYIQTIENFEIETASEALSHSAATLAKDLKASAIVVCTRTGGTARKVSRFRPNINIIGITTDIHAYRQLALSWGVLPRLSDEYSSIDILFYFAKETAKKIIFNFLQKNA